MFNHPRRGSVHRESSLRFLLLLSSSSMLLFVPAFVLPCQAQVVRQLTDQRTGEWGVSGLAGLTDNAAAVDGAGTFVYVNSNTRQLGGNPEGSFQIFRFDAVTGNGQQITHFPKGVSNLPHAVSVSDDGQWLAFISRSDLTGQNHDASAEIFVMHPDGSALAQVTNDPAVNAGSVTALALSGSANRIAFLSNSNPLGTNAGSKLQVFVVNFDGSGLRQLTSATVSSSRWGTLSISDDGERIAFSTRANLTGGNADGSFEVFAVQADGTNLRQISSGSSLDSELPAVAGNGSRIVFSSDGNLTGANADGGWELFAVNWDGTGLGQLTNSASPYVYSADPSVTDDGEDVVFISDNTSGSNADGNREIWRVKKDGTGLTQITNTSSPLEFAFPVVAGSGNRIAATRKQTDPAYSLPVENELFVMSGGGTSVHQLTSTNQLFSQSPAITRDGSRIVFSSDADLLGTNPDGGDEIYRMQSGGSGLVQVTNFSSADSYSPSITADGGSIVFTSDANPTGGNADGTYELFLIHADGTGIRQLTSSTYVYATPYGLQISANGSMVVFSSTINPTGQNPSNALQVFSVHADGTGIRQLTTGSSSTGYYAHVDDSGTWAVFLSGANLDGTNPNGIPQVYRIRTDGTGLQRLSTDVARFALFPDISASGSRIVYISTADPLGTNADHTYEVFLYDTGTGTTRQLTSYTAPGAAFSGNILAPSLTGDGAWVYFSSSAALDEFDPDFHQDIYRVPAAGGPVERVGALTPGALVYPHAPRPDMTGSRVVFDSADDTIEQNPDLSMEVFMIDFTAAPVVRVSKDAPTLVSWDHEAGPIRYDVIRGDIASLSPGAGGTVDLGPVVCLEDDSPDADTRGFEDADQPSPGQSFFYMYRGTRGLNAGPGSWGQSSSGFERVPSSGACAP